MSADNVEVFIDSEKIPGETAVVPGVTVDVIDLSYHVVIRGISKYLLQHVSLTIEPGDMVALMGPSGAGKSTLLDMIANRKLNGFWSGHISINKTDRSKNFNKETAYVLQDDVHLGLLTVEETIYYAGWSRMPEGTSHDDIQKRVDLLLELMGLTNVKSSTVGDSLIKGISGGQLKRLSIAVEIVSLPDLIFLDEPTSGLDSSISLQVMTAVKNLSKQNRTIMSTIHQPSPEVFSLFNKLVLVVSGKLIYFGETSNVVNYFTTLGYTYIEKRNPAEFIIEVASGNMIPADKDVALDYNELEYLFKKSNLYCNPDNLVTNNLSFPIQLNGKFYSSSFWTQFRMLFSREWVCLMRNRGGWLASVLRSIIVSIVCGVIYFDQANNISEPFFIDGTISSGVSGVAAILYLECSYIFYSSNSGIPLICDRIVFTLREMKAGAYKPFPYWLAQIIIVVIPQFVSHWIFIPPVYFLVGFNNNASEFFYFGIILFFLGLVANYFSMMIASIFKNARLSLALSSIAFVFNSLFAGFAIQISALPAFWIWAPYISPSRWCFQGLMINYFNDYPTDDDVSTTGTGNGNVLSFYSFDNFNKNFCFLILFGFMCFNCLVILVFLRPSTSKIIKVNDASDTSQSENIVDYSSRQLIGNVSFRDIDLIGISEESIIAVTPYFSVPSNNTKSQDDDSIQTSFQGSLSLEDFQSKSKSVKPSKGCCVLFKDLNYSVPNNKDRKTDIQLLKGVSGIIESGEMCALMGASGAGKSTLLDVLAGRKTTGKVTGVILFDGKTRTSDNLKSTAYVMQDNVHLSSLTVKQSLYYAAEFRLGKTLSKEEKCIRVNEVMEMLGLSHVADTVVGNEIIRGLSGGQVKRLSIGVEIIHYPSVMFLDEPTTGLDSTVTLEVVSAMKNLANQNRTVIATIHSPSREAGMLFQKLLLLAQGQVIYFGPSIDAVHYFECSPFQFTFNVDSNPFDFVIAVAGSFITSSNHKVVSGTEMAECYSNSSIHQLLIAELDNNIAESSKYQPPIINEVGFMMLNSSTYYQLTTLIHRSLEVMLQDKSRLISGFIRYLVMALLYGFIFINQGRTSTTTAYISIISSFNFTLQNNIFGMTQMIPVIIENRLLYYRERGSGAYGVFPYWVSLWILEIPVIAFNVLFYCIITYFLIGLRNGSNPAKSFGWYYFFELSQTISSLFLFQFTAAISPTTSRALAIIPLMVMIVILFSGYLIFVSTFPIWLIWGPYTSFMRWNFQGLVLNQFQNNADFPEGNTIINTLGFEGQSIYFCLIISIVFIIGNSILFFFALKFVNFEKR